MNLLLKKLQNIIKRKNQPEHLQSVKYEITMGEYVIK